MKNITLEQLLEAGCHFGHKSERWHPKAAEFIWQEKDGIHIIDLAKTKAGLDAAIDYLYELGSLGSTVIFVGTKRQAQGVVKLAATAAGASFLINRWIGGFMTNWDGISKNIKKVNTMTADQATGAWKKFPKHEQMAMARDLRRLMADYEGVLTLSKPPAALVVVDVRKEQISVKEALSLGIPVVGIVDTNANPTGIDYTIPANDDAVGSVELLVNALAQAYHQGLEKFQKEAEVAAGKVAPVVAEPLVANINTIIKTESKIVKEIMKVEKPASPEASQGGKEEVKVVKEIKKPTKVKKSVKE